MAQRPLAPKETVNQLVAALRRLGFRDGFKSDTGSRYLRWEKTPFQLRVSDHHYSTHSALRQVQVVKSFVPPPTSMEDIPLLALELAVKFLVRLRARLGIIGQT